MIQVMFLCSHNDGLSQIAEGLLNKISHAHFKASSAGFYPSPIIQPVKDQMRELSINPENHYPKSVLKSSGLEFDYVIWVGGKMPQINFPFVRGKRAPLSVWHMELSEPDAVPTNVFTKELNREAHLLLTRMHLFVLSHHQEFELAGSH